MNIKKIDQPYDEPQVQDAETTEIEIKKENDEFIDFKQKFNDNAATEQKNKMKLMIWLLTY